MGEPLQLKMEAFVATNGNTASVDTLFSPDTLPHFEILDQSRIDTLREGGGIYLRQTLTLTSWDSGSWSLPSAIRNGIASQPVTIDVTYTSPWNPKQPYHDIKGIVPVKNPGGSTWWWYVIGAAVLVALFLLFFPAGKKENGEPQLDKTAYKKAMDALDKLQGSGTAAANPRQFYTELVNIFRTYLKGAKGIQSFSKTTDDLSVQLQSLKMPQSGYNTLLQTLRLSDLVKFAAYKPEAGITTDAANTVRQSITAIENHAV